MLDHPSKGGRSAAVHPATPPPAPETDLLSEMLLGMRLRGVRYGRCALTAPFGVGFPAQADARLHFVGKGNLVLRIGETDHPLGCGDAVLIPRGTAHEIISGPEVTCNCITSMPVEAVTGEVSTISERPDGGVGSRSETIFFSGSMAFELDTLHPLIALMPEVMSVKSLAASQPELPHLLEAMRREVTLDRAGAAGMLARLADVVAVSIVRAWVEGDCRDVANGWVAALRDPRLGRVILAIHHEPGHNWTVEAMAKVMGASRSSFAARFQEVTGETPLRYLTAMRMRVAARLLDEERLPVDLVAARLGYGSHAAFGRAFRREMGRAPRLRSSISSIDH